MIAFLARQKDYLLAFTHFAIVIVVAFLIAWATDGEYHELLLTMTLFQACFATVRAEK